MHSHNFSGVVTNKAVEDMQCRLRGTGVRDDLGLHGQMHHTHVGGQIGGVEAGMSSEVDNHS